MRGLDGKVAIVTGAGGAIGRSVSLRLAEGGCRVAAFDLDEAAAAETTRAIEGRGGRARAFQCDISDYEACRRAVAESEQALGPTDVLVNNAGWDKFALFLESEPDLWDRLISVNLRGPLNMHHVVLPGMVERKGGRVVNVASDAARVGSTGESVYAACKGGIISFTKTMAREVAKAQICANVVCPGPTDTPLLHSFLGEGELGKKIHASLEKAIPFRRLGKPDDLAGIVAFLASDESAFITGQVVSVSGGLTMNG